MELQKDFYIGIVEDNKDPNRKGRIKIRVQTLYQELAVEDIPYAYPFAGLGGKEFQVPAIGKLVNVLFLSDDLYSPYYIYSENYNANLQNKLKDLSDEEYVDFTALLFDESTQIFIKGKEFTIDQLLNKVSINNSSINLELKDNEQILNLGSRGADQEAVLGTRFFEWMDKFIGELSKPYSLIGNAGAPILKTKLEQLCIEYKTLRPDFVSNNVKIVDNGEVKKLSRTPGTVNNKNDVGLIIPVEENSENQQALFEAIRAQNEKACQTLKNAAPSDKVQLSTIAKDPKAIENIWNKKTKEKISGLHPEMQPYAIAFVNKCKAAGIKLEITSGYRSISEQTALQSTGKAAKPGYSYHNYGLAIDVSSNSDDWDTIGKIGESLGFRWGKYFVKPLSERWHFDMGFGKSTAELKKQYDSGDVSNGYVNLNMSNDQQKLANNLQMNGQDYEIHSDTSSNSASINNPCEGSNAFNRTNSDSNKSNESGQSDENENSGSKKEDQIAENLSNFSCQEKAAKLLLDRIAEGEGATYKKAKNEGVNSPYDITYAYGQYTPTNLSSGKSVQPISSLTIGEIKEVQQLMLDNQKAAGINRNKRSSAIGKYQFISGTFNELTSKLGYDDNVVFSSEVQDKMAIAKLLGRGYNKWINGKMSDEKFQKELSKEWASIADPETGKSYYNQATGTSDDQIKTIMASVKTQMNQCS